MEWPLLASLGAEERRGVMRAARRRKFARNEVVFHEGDPGDALHLIERGHVAARVTTPLGDVATLVVLGPGRHFGELALLQDHPVRTSTVVAVDAVETLSLRREQLDEVRAAHPGIDRVLLTALATAVAETSARLLEALYVPVDKRVLRRLVDLAEVFSDGNGAGNGEAGGAVTVPLTQDDLAGLAGTTRPSANRVLRAAEEAGLVKVARGRVDILDVAGLAKRSR